MIELKYSFEYFCSPIWIREGLNSVFENVSIEKLPLEEDLKKEICDLSTIYQSTYNEEYPPEPINLPLMEEFIFCNRVINSFLQMKEFLPSHYTLISNVSLWEERLNEIKKISDYDR